MSRRTLNPDDTKLAAAHLTTAWTKLSHTVAAAAPETYSRQANAVLPLLARDAAVAVARALAVASDGTDPGHDEALGYLGERVEDEELFPYPWSAYCKGCPQLGGAMWGGSAMPGDFVSVFAVPDPADSDARLAMLLRTTRARQLERRFAVERQTDVRPGRIRRNLARDHKELLAEQLPPTTVFDVFERIAERAERDDGEAFVEAPFDAAEARRLAAALTIVTDATAAAVEAVLAHLIGWDLYGDLLASQLRRSPAGLTALAERLHAARTAVSG
jgi:hypothetical protein